MVTSPAPHRTQASPGLCLRVRALRRAHGPLHLTEPGALRAPHCVRAPAAQNMSFGKFAGAQLFKPEFRPFFYGICVAFISLGSLSLGGTPEAKKESKYLNPPKHH